MIRVRTPRSLLPLLAAVALAISPPATSSVSAQDVHAFEGVAVVPMIEGGQRVLPDRTVLVRGDRIVDVGPAGEVEVPAGAVRIDGRGRWLMPGLAEMHGHMPDGELEEIAMFLYVANGVTTVRGMLGQEHHLALRSRAQRGEIVAPTLYMAGPSFSGNTVGSPAEADARVREQEEAGWDLLKIHPGLTLEEYDAMAEAAHEVGIRFAGHVPADVGLLHAIRMGHETLEHLDGYIEYVGGRDGPVDEERLAEAVRLTREAEAWVVPTQVLWEIGIIGLGDTEAMRAYPEMRYWPEEGVDAWARAQAGRAEAAAEDPERARRWAASRDRLLRELSDGGVGILMGTDSPQMFSVPGFSLHREMAKMRDAGMSIHDILLSGTRNVGEYFRRHDTFGTVAVGRRADLLLLESDPLESLDAVADRAGVMVRGRWIPEEEIQRRLEEIATRLGN